LRRLWSYDCRNVDYVFRRTIVFTFDINISSQIFRLHQKNIRDNSEEMIFFNTAFHTKRFQLTFVRIMNDHCLRKIEAIYPESQTVVILIQRFNSFCFCVCLEPYINIRICNICHMNHSLRRTLDPTVLSIVVGDAFVPPTITIIINNALHRLSIRVIANISVTCIIGK